jgi:mono/diheme cytochrome c family protein
MKPERLLPLILLIAGVAVFYSAYMKKTAQVAVPDQFRGQPAIELFYKHQCVTCHTVSALPSSRGVLGPGLDNIGNRSREYDPEHSGEYYIRESILQPAKVVREGFVNGMPSFEGKMSESELNTLVQWLLTLKEEPSDG